MVQPFRTSTPQYVVCGTDDQHFDIFNKKRKAIKKALEMAMEYPGTTFQVCEKINWESKVIFSINIDVKCMDLETGKVKDSDRKKITRRYTINNIISHDGQ